MKLENIFLERNNKSKSKEKELEEQVDGTDYIYGVYSDQVIILPSYCLDELQDIWGKVKNCLEKKLSFSKVLPILEDDNELWNFIQSEIDNGNGDEIFYLPDTYSLDIGFCNSNILMQNNLPQDFLNQPFVEHSVTGYGEPLIIMKSNDVNKINEYCVKNNYSLKRDDVLMEKCLNPL